MEIRRVTRRRFLSATATSLAAALLPSRLLAQGTSIENVNRTRLILLGTKGGPALNPVKGEARFPTSHLVLIRGVPYVIDCGLGVTIRLVQAGLPLRQLRYIFLTHHHSDHDLEYGNLFYTAWASGLARPVDAWGPPPLSEMTRRFFELNKYDIEIRIPDEGRPDPRPLLRPHEVTGPGLVLQNEEVRITAALRHHPPVVPTFAYRFDTHDRTIVFSGDGADSGALIRLAKDADVLVSEAMFIPGIERLVQRFGKRAAHLLEHLKASHTTTEEAGRIAAAANVKTLVLSHLVPGDDPSITDELWSAGVRQHYQGRIIVGRDLMEV